MKSEQVHGHLAGDELDVSLLAHIAQFLQRGHALLLRLAFIMGWPSPPMPWQAATTTGIGTGIGGRIGQQADGDAIEVLAQQLQAIEREEDLHVPTQRGAVDARIRGGYAMSSVPLVAMIAIFLVAMMVGPQALLRGRRRTCRLPLPTATAHVRSVPQRRHVAHRPGSVAMTLSTWPDAMSASDFWSSRWASGRPMLASNSLSKFICLAP